MRIETYGTTTRFIAESLEEIQLISSSKSISLIELRVSVRNVGMLPDYNGGLIADPSEIVFISNELKRKREPFDVILKSTSGDLPFKKLKHCFVLQSTPEVKFHCDGVE